MRRIRLLPASLLLALVAPAAFADDWPQWLGPMRDGIYREKGVVQSIPQGGLPQKWRVPVGAGYSSPAVVGGRVYLTDRQLKAGASNPANPFDRQSVPGVERVLCLSAKDGQVIWKDEYDVAYTVSYAAGPRAMPTVSGGKVYTVGAEGNLRCYDAQSGKVVWSKSLKLSPDVETPIWGFAAAPLVDGDRLICMADGVNAVVIALNKDTGEVLWKALNGREPGYCPPQISEHAGKQQLIVWHPKGVAGLDPQSGKEYWSHAFEAENGLSIAMPRLVGDGLFVSSNYEGSRLLRLDPKDPTKVTLEWKRGGKGRGEENQTLYALMCTPFISEEEVYGVSRDGALMCININDGKVIWQTYEATTKEPINWGNGFLISLGERGGRFFIFNEKGDLLLADLSKQGYKERGRAHLIDPTNRDAQRPVVWSYPAFAERCVFVRNDKELACFSLAEESPRASR